MDRTFFCSLIWGSRCVFKRMWDGGQRRVLAFSNWQNEFVQLPQGEVDEEVQNGSRTAGSSTDYQPHHASSFGDMLHKDDGYLLPQALPKGPIASQAHHSDRHLLSTQQLVGITFFAVAGGPFGFEAILGAGGPMLMLVGLLFVPFLWSIPLTIMTAEMACMIPEMGGHVLWVYRAFGPFWSFVNSFFAFSCNVLDNAMYPTLFVEYLSALLSDQPGGQYIQYGWGVVLKMLLLIIVTIINIYGIDLVGRVSFVLAAMVVAPFIIVCLLGISYVNITWMGVPISSQVDRGKFLAILLWNISGFDEAGTCASEVKNPGRSYPRALTFSLLLIIGVYGLPALIGVSLIPDSIQWKNGTYINIAEIVGGHFLEVWMGFSATLSAFGLLLTRLCTTSRVVYGMAQVEQLPSVFTLLHPVYATPWVAILATSFWTLFFIFFNFYHLVEADMLFYALSTFLKLGAMVQLRFTEPDVFRPFQIPLEKELLAVLVLIPITMCIAMVAFASERSHAIALLGTSGSVFSYIARELFARYGMDEAVHHRLARVQQNIDKMQQRIDVVIGKEFRCPSEDSGE